MHEIILFGAEFPMQINTVQISYFQALLFYLALLLVLCVRNKKVFTCSMVFLIMFLPANTLLNDQQKAELLLIRNPSDNQCAFVLADPAGDYAVCFNAADAKSMELARKFIASKGINHFNLYVMRGVGKNQLNALAAAVSNLDIGKVIHISRRKLPDEFQLPSDTIYEHIRNSSAQWEISQNSCRFFRKKAQFGFEYFNTEAIIPLCIIFDSENQTVAVGENTENKTVWKNSNLLEYSVYGL